jgi:hypothetical protein
MVCRWPIEIDGLLWFTVLKNGGIFDLSMKKTSESPFELLNPSIYTSCPWLDRCVPLGYFRAKPAARPEARYAPSTSLRPASATKSTRKAPDSWCFMFLHNQIHPNSTNHPGFFIPLEPLSDFVPYQSVLGWSLGHHIRDGRLRRMAFLGFFLRENPEETGFLLPLDIGVPSKLSHPIWRFNWFVSQLP